MKNRLYFLYAAFSGRDGAASGYIAYLGTENVKSYRRKEKAQLLLSERFSAVLSETTDKKTDELVEGSRHSS